MDLHITPEMTRKQRATVYYLNRATHLIVSASTPAHELRYIYGQVKDPGWLWGATALAYQNRQTAENRWFLRLVAFLWSAGVRPAAGTIDQSVTLFLDKVAFLLIVHRELPDWPPLPDSAAAADRAWLLRQRTTDIASCAKRYSAPIDRSSLRESLRQLRMADMALYRVDEQCDYKLVHKLAEYLSEFCLLPEDIGVSANRLRYLRYSQLVEEAKLRLDACELLDFKDQPISPAVRVKYAHVYGRLKLLTEGVTLAEVHLTLDWLQENKSVLERLLADAATYSEEERSGSSLILGLMRWVGGRWRARREAEYARSEEQGASTFDFVTFQRELLQMVDEALNRELQCL